MSIASSLGYISYLSGNESNPYHLNHIREFAELSKRISIEQINNIVPHMVEDVCRKTINATYE